MYMSDNRTLCKPEICKFSYFSEVNDLKPVITTVLDTWHKIAASLALALHMKETQFAESLIRQLSRCPHLHRFLTQTGSRCGLLSLNSSF